MMILLDKIESGSPPKFFSKTKNIYMEVFFRVKIVVNKMELLQSQAPVDWELSGSSASDRHETSDIVYQTWNVGHGTYRVSHKK